MLTANRKSTRSSLYELKETAHKAADYGSRQMMVRFKVVYINQFYDQLLLSLSEKFIRNLKVPCVLKLEVYALYKALIKITSFLKSRHVARMTKYKCSAPRSTCAVNQNEAEPPPHLSPSPP